jgi:nicotinamide mononucleotide transporter
MNNILSVNNIVFEIWGYPLSYIELVSTVFGLISVYLASRPNIWTWPTGILNEFGFFILFFQVHLYANMLLQVFFFVVTVYGWYYWGAPASERRISRIKSDRYIWLIVLLTGGTLGLGALVSNLNVLLPGVFAHPADYPYADAYTTVASIIAMLLLARKCLESWLLWISVDLVCIVLYHVKGIQLMALEYALFLIIATYGYLHWKAKIHE